MERTPFNPEEAEWETKKVIDDYKFKLQKAEQDISTCQTNVSIMGKVLFTADCTRQKFLPTLLVLLNNGVEYQKSRTKFLPCVIVSE